MSNTAQNFDSSDSGSQAIDSLLSVLADKWGAEFDFKNLRMDFTLRRWVQQCKEQSEQDALLDFVYDSPLSKEDEVLNAARLFSGLSQLGCKPENLRKISSEVSNCLSTGAELRFEEIAPALLKLTEQSQFLSESPSERAHFVSERAKELCHSFANLKEVCGGNVSEDIAEKVGIRFSDFRERRLARLLEELSSPKHYNQEELLETCFELSAGFASEIDSYTYYSVLDSFVAKFPEESQEFHGFLESCLRADFINRENLIRLSKVYLEAAIEGNENRDDLARCYRESLRASIPPGLCGTADQLELLSSEDEFTLAQIIRHQLQVLDFAHTNSLSPNLDAIQGLLATAPDSQALTFFKRAIKPKQKGQEKKKILDALYDLTKDSLADTPEYWKLLADEISGKNPQRFFNSNRFKNIDFLLKTLEKVDTEYSMDILEVFCSARKKAPLDIVRDTELVKTIDKAFELGDHSVQEMTSAAHRLITLSEDPEFENRELSAIFERYLSGDPFMSLIDSCLELRKGQNPVTLSFEDLSLDKQTYSNSDKLALLLAGDKATPEQGHFALLNALEIRITLESEFLQKGSDQNLEIAVDSEFSNLLELLKNQKEAGVEILGISPALALRLIDNGAPDEEWLEQLKQKNIFQASLTRKSLETGSSLIVTLSRSERDASPVYELLNQNPAILRALKGQCSIEEPISVEALALIQFASLETSERMQFRKTVAQICSVCGSLDPEDFASAKQLLSVFLDREIPIYLFSPQILLGFDRAGSEEKELFEVFLRGMKVFSEREFVGHAGQDALLRLAEKYLDHSSGMLDNPGIAHKFELASKSGDFKSFAAFVNFVQQLHMHALADISLFSKDELRRTWARRKTAREFSVGEPPYHESNPEYPRYFKVSTDIYRAAVRDSIGFGEWAQDARHIPSSEFEEASPALLVRAAEELGAEVEVFNSSGPQSFPGTGYRIRGVQLERFIPNLDHAAQVIENFAPNFSAKNYSDVEFTFLRGLIIVSSRKNADSYLDGIQYSYLVYNRHFYPHGAETALGVPSDIIEKRLARLSVPIDEYSGFDRSKTDINELDWSLDALEHEAKSIGLNLLNLGSGAAFAAGLPYAFPLGSAPYFTWEEEEPVSSSQWRDAWRRVHAAYLNWGSYGHVHREKAKRTLENIRKLNDRIATTISCLQSDLSMFRYAASNYKHGFTISGLKPEEPEYDLGIDFQAESEKGIEKFQGEESQLSDEAVFSQGPSLHPKSYRMLEELYRWRAALQFKQAPLSEYPTLFCSHIATPGSTLSNRYEIDSRSMILKLADTEIQLPIDSNGQGDEERAIWAEHVVPFFRSGLVPVLLPGQGAYQLHE